ncbi:MULTISPECIES: hypothetical protein [Actinomadura]|uniref:Histidine kinase n=1 Tax=Actinomadura yumaensis TaxID=111807 RepID=A0ABW2D1R3_9ACTN|nr:hypothetical protein [Actinomadura sp. J1-007]MWK38895.1 hypothetical protein [Actinomadura sp. J1-007]
MSEPPGSEPPSGTPAAAPFVPRFHRAFDVAVVSTVVLWQVVAAGTALLVYLPHFRPPAAAAAAWAAQVLIIAAGAAALLRGGRSRRVAWTLTAADLAAGAAVAAACPEALLLKIDWGWTSTGMIAVLLLLRRPARELVAVLLANAGVVLAVLCAGDALSRHNVAGVVTLVYASASVQLALLAGARVFRDSGGLAADAAAEQWEIANREAVIAEVVTARRARYRSARTVVEPLLRGLADGTADPSDPELRRRCAAAEAALRHVLTEREDVPDPVMRALRPGIDDAVRRGVVVDVASVGDPPRLPDRTGTALSRAPLAALASTRRYARVTVVSTGPDEVSVSVLGDGELALPPRGSARDGVTLVTDHDDDLHWVEARWRES